MITERKDVLKRCKVISQSVICRNRPFIVVETKEKTYTSRIIKYYPCGKILNVYEVSNGYAKISKYRNRWVPVSGLLNIQ